MSNQDKNTVDSNTRNAGGIDGTGTPVDQQLHRFLLDDGSDACPPHGEWL